MFIIFHILLFNPFPKIKFTNTS